MDALTKNKIRLYKEIADLTKPECETVCHLPLSCCSSEYCYEAILEAKENYNVDLVKTNHKTLPLMSETGCIAEPHYRRLCTFHVCSINAFGIKPNDEEFTNKYFQLRDEIMEIEFQEMQLKAYTNNDKETFYV